MGLLVFDANKTTSYILPTLTKIKTDVNNAYSICDKVKWYLPSSFSYRSTLTDMCTNLNNIKNQLNNLKTSIERKVETANNLDLKNRSSVDKLSRQAATIGTIETDSVSNKLNIDKVDFSKDQLILNLDNEIEKLETEKKLLDKKIKDLTSNINLQEYGIARARGLYSGHPELENWKKELEKLKKDRDELTNQITQLKQQKDYFIKYLKEQTYINFSNNNDFSDFNQVNLTKEEATNILNLLLAFDTASPGDNPILTFDFLYGNVSYEEMKTRFDNSTLGQYHTNIDWKLVESACKKGFSIFELCVLNPDLAQHASNYIYGDLSTADQNLLNNLYRLGYMTEEERKTIIYIYQAQSPESASEYLNFKEQEINSRIGMYKALEFLETIDVNDPNVGDYIDTTLKGLGDGSLNFLEGIYNATGGMDGIISVQQYQAMYIMNGLTSEQLASIDFLTEDAKNKLKGLSENKILGGTYEISSSIGNMLPAMATSAIVSLIATPAAGNLVGTTLMGVSSGGNAAESAYQQGYGYWQSIFYGALSGTSEATLGYFLGGIPGISKLSNLSGFKGFLVNIASEGAEESLQAILDPYLMSLATGTEPKINWDEVIKSGIYGMITAGILNSGNMVINGNNVNINGIDTEIIETIYLAEQSGIKVDYSRINDKAYIDTLKLKNGSEIVESSNVNISSSETIVDNGNSNTITTKINSKNKTKSSQQNEIKLSDLKYKSTGKITYLLNYLKSNINKFRYTNTNSVNGLNNQIKENGLYHFTTSVDAILESGYIKATNENLIGVLGFLGSSYGNPKTFFFSGVPDVGAFVTNLDGLPLKTEAVKIDPTETMLNSENLKVREFDDGAISWDGRVNLEGLNATKEYFILVKENDQLVYKSVTKEVYDNYETTLEGKAIAEFVSKKSNVDAIKQNYLAELAMKSTNAKISGYNRSIVSTTDSLESTGAVVSVTENLNKIEKFFKYDLEVKKLLGETAPNESYRYNRESLLEYSDKLYKAIDDFEYYISKMLESYNFSDIDKKYFSNYISTLRNELIKCGYDYNKLSKFYEMYFSNMSEELVNKVGSEIKGGTYDPKTGLPLSGGVPLNEAKSINEILHIVHQSVVNNENNYRNLPVLAQKQNIEGNNITLYGRESDLAKKIYDTFPIDIESDFVEIMSLGNNKVLLMVRDVGHALSIEIEKDGDKCYVRYFIPKICNVDMVNELKGVTKVTTDSIYTVGVFETTTDQVSSELMDFISKVPTDADLPANRNYRIKKDFENKINSINGDLEVKNLIINILQMLSLTGNSDNIKVMNKIIKIGDEISSITFDDEFDNGTWDDETKKLSIGQKFLSQDYESKITITHEIGHILLDFSGIETTSDLLLKINEFMQIDPNEIVEITNKKYESCEQDAQILFLDDLKKNGYTLESYKEFIKKQLLPYMQSKETLRAFLELSMELDETVVERIIKSDINVDEVVELIVAKEVTIRQESIYESKYPQYAALEDIIDALAEGNLLENEFIRYGHGTEYYSDGENILSELVANYTSLRLTDSNDAIKILEETYGSEFCDQLESIYQKIIN